MQALGSPLHINQGMEYAPYVCVCAGVASLPPVQCERLVVLQPRDRGPEGGVRANLAVEAHLGAPDHLLALWSPHNTGGV